MSVAKLNQENTSLETMEVAQVQESPTVIQIDSYAAIGGTVVLFLGIVLGAGKILERVAGLGKRLERIEDCFDDIIKGRFASANSPIQLNEKGNKILNESKIGNFIDEDKSQLLEIARKKEFSNPYDAERGLLELLRIYIQEKPEELKKLKESAFNTGIDLESLFFVGSIYLRNSIFKELGFEIDDLDKIKK